MILDNFTLLTDEIAEGEDELEWGDAGPSSKQFAKIVDSYERVSGGGQYISLSGLRGLMMQLKRPLGYLTEDGKIIFEAKDRWEEGLIRSELNVILMEERKQKAESKQSRWNRILASVSVEQRFLNAVRFKDVIYTMLVWRKPSLIPLYVKSGRAQRIEKVLQVSDCLVILRFLTQVSGERMKAALQRQLRARAAFVRWTKEEPIQKRRMIYKESRKGCRAFPSNNTKVELALLNHGFEVTNSHHECLAFAYKRVNTQASLHLFRQKSLTDIVVLKYVDPLHSGMGLVTADFTECLWEGWSLRQWARDSFFEPGTEKDEQDGVALVSSFSWVKVDFAMPVRIYKGGKKQIVSKYQGTLKDIHSVTISSSKDELSLNGDVSPSEKHVLRLNVGSYEAPNVNSGPRAKTTSNKMYDAVFEVVGYVSFEHELLHPSMGSHKLTEMPAEELGTIGGQERST
jgi:hypothetical protein